MLLGFIWLLRQSCSEESAYSKVVSQRALTKVLFMQCFFDFSPNQQHETTQKLRGPRVCTSYYLHH